MDGLISLAAFAVGVIAVATGAVVAFGWGMGLVVFGVVALIIAGMLHNG